MNSAPIAYLNGRFLPQAEASLPLHDAGFVMGATVTDFCRTYNHVLFRWPDHVARFRRDCAACGIGPIDADMDAIAAQLLAYNGGEHELALISFATPGSIGYYLGEPGNAGDAPPTFGMHTFPLPLSRYRRFFERGITLRVPIQHLANPAGVIDPQIKHRSRLAWWILSRTTPGAIPLLFDSQTKSVTETAFGNLLIVEKGTVVTPWRDTILDGISLRVVEELCRDLGIPFVEGAIGLERCRDADEAMLCGSAFALAPVAKIEEWPLTWPGPVYKRLLDAWSERVGVDIAAQFLAQP